ncbi:hypothetical protein [Legionella parisiensis]|uniref:Uncharacterized protein n=1 Tax=Legionella parisiensis TaxID=45071 RepID=A0A1E5JMH9_9GAMM|nr:hypothetical protein [Legionella parisiensis]KTD41722.1 hypothetical protein Lpar_3039 [Legionella parisiensis]OEH45739.1 hypothetical protein lpari_03252 [Legionella parisiensis]STX75956.1 Uncharacterised protein [Legionella parisiensis]
MFIPDNATPSNPSETTFLIPVTLIQKSGSVDGYLSVLLNQQNQFEVVGFQNAIGSSNTVVKLAALDQRSSVSIRSYAQVNSVWGLTQTTNRVNYPFTISFGGVSSDLNAFRFLAGDTTGVLIISPTFKSYQAVVITAWVSVLLLIFEFSDLDASSGALDYEIHSSRFRVKSPNPTLLQVIRSQQLNLHKLKQAILHHAH